jgi:hypothetical protein
MALEFKVPHDRDFRALLPLWPVFMSYVLSFVYVGIYWNKLQYGSHPSGDRIGNQICGGFNWQRSSI